MFGIDNIVEASTLSEEPLKLALIGVPGVGKSWIAATAPQPVFDIDFDNRKSSLAGKIGVTVKTYVDINPNSPNAMADLEADLNVIEDQKEKGNPIPATFVIDSLTYMKKAIDNELMKQQPTLGRGLRVGTRTVKIGQNYDIYNGCKAYTEYMIGRLSALGNLIVVCHARDEKDKKTSTATERKFTGKITIEPEFLSTILSLFNDCWLVETNWKSERIIKTGISDNFIGKNSLGITGDVTDPNISSLLAAHRAKLAVK